MHRFFGAHHARMRCVHIVVLGGDQLTFAVCGVALLDAKILHPQLADGHGHPAILVAVIVNAAYLSGFPADGDDFEELVLEDQNSA